MLVGLHMEDSMLVTHGDIDRITDLDGIVGIRFPSLDHHMIRDLVLDRCGPQGEVILKGGGDEMHCLVEFLGYKFGCCSGA